MGENGPTFVSIGFPRTTNLAVEICPYEIRF